MSRLSLFQRFVPIAAVGLAVSCQSEPASVEPALSNAVNYVNPQLGRITSSSSSVIVRPGSVAVISGNDAPNARPPVPGILRAVAYRAHAGDVIPKGARVHVTVRTSDGDTEILNMKAPPCPARCRAFELGIRDSSHAYQLVPKVDALSARFSSVVLGENPRAVVWVISGDLDLAMRVARMWPGVRYARPTDQPQATQGMLLDPDLDGVLPIDFGAIVPNDGKIQVHSGATLVLEYIQPDGTTLTEEINVNL